MALRNSSLIPNGRTSKLDDLVRRTATADEYMRAMYARRGDISRMFYQGDPAIRAYMSDVPTPLAIRQFLDLADRDAIATGDYPRDPMTIGGVAPDRLKQTNWHAEAIAALTRLQEDWVWAEHQKWQREHNRYKPKGSRPKWLTALLDGLNAIPLVGTLVSETSKAIQDGINAPDLKDPDGKANAEKMEQAFWDLNEMLKSKIADLQKVSPAVYNAKVNKDIDRSFDARIAQLQRRGVSQAVIDAVIRGEDVDEEAALEEAQGGKSVEVEPGWIAAPPKIDRMFGAARLRNRHFPPPSFPTQRGVKRYAAF